MPTIIVYYGFDSAKAKEIAGEARKAKGRGYVRDARAFDGQVEPCDRAIVLNCASEWDTDRLRAAYGERFEAEAVPVAPKAGRAPAALSAVPGGLEAAAPAIPDDWQGMKWFAKRSLALKLSGSVPKDAAEADSMIEAEIERRG